MMSKHDLFAALAVSRFIELQTGWSIREFVKTARRCRTGQIQADPHVVTAADPIPTTPAKHSARSTTHAEVRTSDQGSLGRQTTEEADVLVAEFACLHARAVPRVQHLAAEQDAG